MAELPLLHASLIGDVNEVQRLLQARHDIDERGEPLTKDELKNLRWLITEAGVNEAAQAVGRPFDYTPLMAALGEGQFEVAQALLDAGAEPNSKDSLGRTPLMQAIGWKQVELAKRLIAVGADVNAKDLSGSPVLTQAIETGLWAIANALLDAGAHVKPRAKKDCLPLSAVVYKSGDQASEVMLRLLREGATITDPQLISYAVGNHNDEVVAKLLDEFPALASRVSGGELLSRAAKERKTSTLRLLAEKGICATNAKEESSPLVDLIIGPARSSLDFHKEKYINDEREIECMQILVGAGAEVNHTGGNRKHPLFWAVQFYRSELCRWLLEHGADPNCLSNGKCSLDEAYRMLREAIPKYKLNAREKEQYQRLEAEAHKMIALLKEHGARSGVPSASSDTDEGDDHTEGVEIETPVLSKPVAERRGLCDATFFKAYQIMIRADIDKIADVLEKDRKFVAVERDVYQRLDKLKRPVGDVLSVVKLKGQSWTYVSGRRPQANNPMRVWSKNLKAPVLYAGEESVASVVFYALYDRGDCVEAFESDGQWFRGGVEIDPDVQEESDRMHGTSFSSQLQDADKVDWSAYKSEWDFLDSFLRKQDAYLTFIAAGFEDQSGPAKVFAYHEDEASAEAIERVDLAFYKPTVSQERAANAPPQQEDLLYESIKAGDLNAARQAVEGGVKLNELPPRSDSSYLVTALGCALYNRSQEIVDLFLQSGSDPNFGGAEPPLPRMMTWRSQGAEHLRMVLKLLAAGAEVNSRKPSSKDNPFLPGGETALHKAASSGCLNHVKLLLRHGADPMLKDGADRTPLDAARAWLKAVKLDRVKDVPSFTNELHLPVAEETVAILDSFERGELDIGTLPNDEELIKAEERLQAAHRCKEEEML